MKDTRKDGQILIECLMYDWINGIIITTYSMVILYFNALLA